MTTKPDTSLFTAACMIINSIDPTADADPDTMLRVRVTETHVVVITHRGQKFSVPIGTVKAAAQAHTVPVSREAEAQTKPDDGPPTTTIKGGPAQPAKTIKKTTRKRTTSRK